jgi:acyl-CoA reductase-like NAD-dependent aldehyde dehydrogenase
MAKAAQKSTRSTQAPTRRRAIMLRMDEELRNELDVLATARKQSIQQLGVEAICDLLRDALRRSAGEVRKPNGGVMAPAKAALPKKATKTSRQKR